MNNFELAQEILGQHEFTILLLTGLAVIMVPIIIDEYNRKIDMWLLEVAQIDVEQFLKSQ